MKTLITLCIALILTSCNTRYKQITRAIASLPPKKLLSKSQHGSSGITSKIDSILGNFSISSQQRLDLILDLDKELKSRFLSYKKQRSNAQFDGIVQRLNEISVDKDIKVTVQINTKTPGAFIRYRTQALQDSIIADNPTNNCVLNLYLGNYYIWTARSGRRTSVPQKHYILQTGSITVEENIK